MCLYFVTDLCGELFTFLIKAYKSVLKGLYCLVLSNDF